MSDSVGQIGLDLVVNKNGFEKQMSGIQGMAKKAGAALAAAFAVKKIVDFGAECIKLGSDLQEVQNVVDVTFPQMKKQVDSFAQNAATSFGLSETMAKRFTGTFGAMAKSFGFNEKAAYDMSTTLTGLSGDVASFYNISQDEAFTKLKSVFTGETESLKDLGIVMTQTALDQYALANGYGKTTQAMSEGEKVALRYKFVTDQLSGASGDFLRTSDGWANQVRLLKLQFDSLKATIGQGLIAVLTPVIKVINSIIGKILSLANAFKAFVELITGKKGSGGTSVAASGMDDLSGAADNASAAMGSAGSAASGAGGAAKKAAKDIKGASTGIDELNIVSAPDGGSGGGGSGGGGGGGGYAADEFDMGTLADPGDEIDNKYQGLIDKVKELKDLFKDGFWTGLGDTSVFDSIGRSFDSIKKSLKEIFADPAVLQSVDGFAKKLSYNLGLVAGSIVSVGATIADNLLGGISLYLEQNESRIKESIIALFNIGGEIADIVGQTYAGLADIFTVFRSDSAKQITADIISVFSNGFLGALELAGMFGRDVIGLITSPIIENTEGFKTAFGGILETVQTVTSAVSETFAFFVDGFVKLYKTHVSPVIDSFKQGFTEIVKAVLEAFNTHILPVIQNAADRFSEFCTSTLQPLIEKFFELGEKIAECIKVIWENVLLPFILWFVENIAPIIAENLQTVVDAFFSFWESMSKVLDNVIDALGGLMDFITGVFTGDWERAWDGIKQFFSNIWETMKSIVETLFNAIGLFIETMLLNVKSVWELIWQTIKNYFKTIWDNIKTTVTTILDSVQIFISTKIDAIKTGLEEKLDAIKTKWDTIWDGIKTKASDIWDGIKGIVTGSVDAIVLGVEGLVNGVIKAINWLIRQINKISIDVPETPFTDGFTMGFDIKELSPISFSGIPALAQGGFVKANTPQLAMIGDNRHYGEIVAPEDKMQEMVDKAVSMVSGNSVMSDHYLSIMADLLKKIIDLIESMDLTVNIDIREIKKKLVDLDKRTGYSLKTT